MGATVRNVKIPGTSSRELESRKSSRSGRWDLKRGRNGHFVVQMMPEEAEDPQQFSLHRSPSPTAHVLLRAGAPSLPTRSQLLPCPMEEEVAYSGQTQEPRLFSDSSSVSAVGIGVVGQDGGETPTKGSIGTSL